MSEKRNDARRAAQRRCLSAGLALWGFGVLLWAASGAPALAQIDPNARYSVAPIPAGYDIRQPEGLDRNADPEGYRKAMDAWRNAKTNRSDLEKRVRLVLTGATPLVQGQRDLRLMLQILLAEMTQTDEPSLLEMPRRRERFIRDYLRKVARDNVHDEINQFTLRAMSNVVRGNYHPAVRVNAMLIIGQLNSIEPVLFGQGQRGPVPYLEALKVLVQEYRSSTQLDAVRAAALVGILRHAELDGQRREDQRMELTYRYALIGDMLRLVQEKNPPAGRSPEGHRWFQQRAAEILGALRDPGADNVVAKTLDAIISDESYPVDFRFTAAMAYSKLKFPNPQAINPSAAVQKVVALTSTGCHDELDRLQREFDQLLQKTAAATGRKIEELKGTGEAKLENYKLVASRRLLKTYILYSQEAIGKDDSSGLWRYAQAEKDRKFVADVASTLKEMMKATDRLRRNDPPLTAPKLIAQVSHHLKELDKMLALANAKASGPGSAKPAGPGPALPGGPLPDGQLPDATLPVPLPGVPAPGAPPAVPAKP